MPGVSKREVWLVDFGMVAKVRPALLLTGEPADDELDLGDGSSPHDGPARQPLGTESPQALPAARRLPFAADSKHLGRQAGAEAGRADAARDPTSRGGAAPATGIVKVVSEDGMPFG